jgi:hypothetical protein
MVGPTLVFFFNSCEAEGKKSAHVGNITLGSPCDLDSTGFNASTGEAITCSFLTGVIRNACTTHWLLKWVTVHTNDK